MDVGVRELKKHLSAWLERAARGELIRVTDRGEPKALLGPLPGRLRIEEGVAAGWLVRGEPVEPAPARRHRSTGTTASVLAEDRDE